MAVMRKTPKNAKGRASARNLPDRALSPGTAAGVRGGEDLLVAFDTGAPRTAYQIGSLWNGKDRPPAQR
jgi:hypothetical protein